MIKALTGVDLPLPVPVFGLSVVAAMFVAGAFLRRELARLRAAGALGHAPAHGRPVEGNRLKPRQREACSRSAGMTSCRLATSNVGSAWESLASFSGLNQQLSMP